jgi:chromosome segregation ATPase
MGKIRITESELRNVIHENVENVLKEAYTDRMARRNDRYQTARNNYNNYTRSWNQLTQPEQAAYNQKAGNGWTGEALYNDEKKQAGTKLRRMTRRNGYQFQQDLNKTKGDLNKTKGEYAKAQDEVAKLTQNNQLLQQQVADYSQALTMISDKLGLAKQAKNALEEEAATQGQQMTNAQRIAQPALTAINKLQTALANARMQAQQQQKAQQQAQQQRAQTNAQMTQAISAPAKPMPQAPAAQPKAPQQGLKRG